MTCPKTRSLLLTMTFRQATANLACLTDPFSTKFCTTGRSRWATLGQRWSISAPTKLKICRVSSAATGSSEPRKDSSWLYTSSPTKAAGNADDSTCSSWRPLTAELVTPIWTSMSP
uniref:Putative secreted protein n=1 Tax=Ixodes ricinus TaxID=34613 RepID=A0A6B0ULH2_IXORI